MISSQKSGNVLSGQSKEGNLQRWLRARWEVNRVTVYGWLALYRSGGWDRLDARKRGGRKPRLDAKAMKWIYEAVTMKQPYQFHFPFSLWTSKFFARLIAKHLGVRLSKASVCRLLVQMGRSAQRPLWRAYQHHPEAVRQWMEEHFPALLAQARAHRAELWFGDEAGVRSDAHWGTTWSPKGMTPIVSTTGARCGIHLISAVSRRGNFRFMCVNGRVTAPVFIDFLKRLMHDAQRKMFLIVDGHPTHKAVAVKKFLEKNTAKLRLFHLPPYSHESNPDEMIWDDLKNNCLGRKAIFSADHLKSEVMGFLRFLQKSPSRILSYFQTPTTCYAA